MVLTGHREVLQPPVTERLWRLPLFGQKSLELADRATDMRLSGPDALGEKVPVSGALVQRAQRAFADCGGGSQGATRWL